MPREPPQPLSVISLVQVDDAGLHVPPEQSVVPLILPGKIVVPLVQPVVPEIPSAHPGALPPLNSSQFKLEFVGKPKENAETQLIRRKDWIDTHAFHE